MESPSKKKRKSANSSSSGTGSSGRRRDQDRHGKKTKQGVKAAKGVPAVQGCGGGSDDGTIRGIKRKIGCVEAAAQFGRKKNLDRHYTLGAQLGHGKFGSVNLCYKKSTGETFACKALEKNTGEEATAHREVEIMQHLSGHPGIVTLKEVFEDSDKFYLVMELCSGGRLFDFIANEGSKFAEKKAAEVIKELMTIVSYSHEMGVVHRDIKPENILLTDTGRMKLADFGLATRVADGQKLSGFVGSPGYVAPEVITGNYTEKADIWGVGVLLHVLLLGYLPFRGDSKEAVFEAVKTLELDFHDASWQSVSLSARDLISRMLTRDVSVRLTADQVLGHAWIVDNMINSSNTNNSRINNNKKNNNECTDVTPSVEDSGCDIVDALAFAISRIEISEPKRSRICGSVPAPSRLELKTNICAAF